MNDTLHCRPVRAGDAGRVRTVYERAMRDAGAFLPGADHSDLDAPAEAYAAGAFLVGEVETGDGGEVVAVGGVRPVDDEDEGVAFEMKRVAVLPAHQGRGYGRAIVRALEAAARECGAERLVLETGEEQRAARALYESLGYERVERVSYVDGEVVGIRYVREP